MTNIFWIGIFIIDTIIKAFQYGWFILLALLSILIIILVKRKKISNFGIIFFILAFTFLSIILTSRIWGPKLYMRVIGGQLESSEKLIEKKLEEKYDKNFTFLSKGKIKPTDSYISSSAGEDVNTNFVVIYKFIDDDGVVAIVEYKKNYGLDYYQVKRAQYDIEQAIYAYANELGIQAKIYVKDLNRFESIIGSSLDELPEADFLNKEMSHDNILFVMTEKIDDSKDFISKALTTIFSENKYLTVNEYVVTESEFKKIKNYYEGDSVREELGDVYEKYIYKINDNNIINYEWYFVH